MEPNLCLVCWNAINIRRRGLARLRGVAGVKLCYLPVDNSAAGVTAAYCCGFYALPRYPRQGLSGIAERPGKRTALPTIVEKLKRNLFGFE